MSGISAPGVCTPENLAQAPHARPRPKTVVSARPQFSAVPHSSQHAADDRARDRPHARVTASNRRRLSARRRFDHGRSMPGVKPHQTPDRPNLREPEGGNCPRLIYQPVIAQVVSETKQLASSVMGRSRTGRRSPERRERASSRRSGVEQTADRLRRTAFGAGTANGVAAATETAGSGEGLADAVLGFVLHFPS